MDIKIPADFTLLIDTRESQPYRFKGCSCLFTTLHTGDYSVKGFADTIIVERKTPPDFLSCITRERERFIQELERMQGYRYKCLVVEGTFAGLFKPPEAFEKKKKVADLTIINSVSKIMAEYHLPIAFATNYSYARNFTLSYLIRCYQILRGLK